MDPERQRIQEDLRGLVGGEVRCDDLFLELYASDASLYQIRPLGVVRPRNTDDVATVVKYAAEKQIPIHARGAGSGLAGESLGRGIIIDFSRFMRRILRTDAESVRVQVGVVHAKLNEYLEPTGRVFGPDPANSTVTTIGSVIALDASGSYWLKYGSARRHIRSLQVVLADGTVMEVGRERLPDSAAATVATEVAQTSTELRRRELVERLQHLLALEAPLIARHQPRSLLNRSGYQLLEVLTKTHLDFCRLLCGSEGTLALVTEATIATQSLPRHRAVALLMFDRLESAAAAVAEILPFGPSACDLFDRRHLSLARESSPEYGALLSSDAEALLLVEFSGDDAATVRQQLGQMVDRICRKKQLAFDSRQAFDLTEVAWFWQLTRRVVPTLHRLKGNSRPLPFVEDVAVPPSVLTEFLVQMQNTLKKHQITAALYGHVGHGQLHIRPFLDLSNPDDVRKMQALADDLYADVFAVGGTISGEHAVGLSRTPYVKRQFGPLYEVFRQVKSIFDPLNILNPGKIVTDNPQPITHNLRHAGTDGARLGEQQNLSSGAIPTGVLVSETKTNGAVGASAEMTGDAATAETSSAKPIPLHLNWTIAAIAHEAERCNGCGTCRSQLPDMRMCPIFRVAPKEEASPRAKANLLRAVLEHQLDPSTIALDDFKAIADLCVNCHQCRVECPSNVDIPKLMIEAKAMYVDTNGLRPSDWLMARFDRLSRFGSAVSPVANWALHNRVARWLMEKTLGIAQGRKLPRFAAQLHAPRWSPPSDAPHAPQRSQGAVFRRYLRQLSRSAVGRSAGCRYGAQRSGRLCASQPKAQRHGADYFRLAGRCAAWPPTTSTCWQKPSGKAITSSPPSRQPSCASRTNTFTCSTMPTRAPLPPTRAKRALTFGNCTVKESCSSISNPFMPR